MRGLRSLSTAATLALVALPVIAHPVQGASVGAAFLHPLTGLDHVAAMLAVGALGGMGERADGRGVAGLPAAFLAAVLAGALAGAAGVALPGVEHVIALSVVVLGVAVAGMTRLPLAAGMALVALFGLAHGHAHGSELLLNGGTAFAVPAFLAASALLLALGTLAGRAARTAGPRRLLRLAGAGAAATGAVLLGTL